MAVFVVRTSLETANTRLAVLQTDPILSGGEQALCGELIQANTLALNVMRADGTLPPPQRAPRAQQIEDKVFAAAQVQVAHEADYTPAEFYNVLDACQDSATAIRAGAATYEAVQ